MGMADRKRAGVMPSRGGGGRKKRRSSSSSSSSSSRGKRRPRQTDTLVSARDRAREEENYRPQPSIPLCALQPQQQAYLQQSSRPAQAGSLSSLLTQPSQQDTHAAEVSGGNANWSNS